jgi:hypothetical protein
MKRLVVTAAALFLAHQTQAADISVVANETDDNPAIILIKGRFESADAKKDVATFSTLSTALHKPAIVFLDSLGGSLWTGIQIGTTIRRFGFSTAVADGTICASACATIWMGGKERYMAGTSRIGFHAAVNKEKPEVTAAVNAMLGFYFHEVGVRDIKAVYYLTKAGPETLTWLTPEAAARYGIEFTHLNLSHNQWAWAREALATRMGYGLRGRIDAQGHLPAASAYSEPAQNPLEKPAEPRPPEKAKEQDRRASPELAAARQAQHNDLIAQALRRIESGDVAGAREMLAAAVDDTQGLVSFTLAETYDPHMLAAWGARGVVADVVRARAFYRKALNLGVASAYERLEALK